MAIALTLALALALTLTSTLTLTLLLTVARVLTARAAGRGGHDGPGGRRQGRRLYHRRRHDRHGRHTLRCLEP